MRFLQTEWHRHERDRNAWEIEREEMKKRIAGLEGEARSSKGMRGILERQIRMLELALKRERDNVNRLKKGEHIEVLKDPRDAAREELEKSKEAGKCMLENQSITALTDIATALVSKAISQLDAEIDAENHLTQGIRQEKERDKSKSYLSKCSSEITYRVLPTTHIPPETTDPSPTNHLLGGRQPSQQELIDAYVQMQQIKHQQHKNNVAMVRENALPPQQHPVPAYADPAPLMRSNTQVHNAQLPIREAEKRIIDQPILPLTPSENRRLIYSEQNVAPEEQVESVSHSYDGYGRQIPSKEESDVARTVDESKADLADGWDFDDPPPPAGPPPENSIQHRPDTEEFPRASLIPPKSPPRAPGSYRRKSSGARRRSEGGTDAASAAANMKSDAMQFKVKFAMRGHLDVVRSVIFTGGGSPSEPEFCTAGDDGTVKRWHIPASYAANNISLGDDLDRIAHFTHRGHTGAVCSLAACPATPNFSNGGRVAGDGWIFSGGEDASVKVWERGRVDAKASLEGHTDAIWALCVLPGTAGTILGDKCSQHGGPERVLLAAGASDGTILIWAVSAPPQLSSPHASNRGTRGSRRSNSISAGSNFPSSPQPSVASNIPFHYSLVHRIVRSGSPSPTSISALSPNGENFVVSYTDASVLVFDTRNGEEIVGMASQETYDGTPGTAVNAVVARPAVFEGAVSPNRRGSMNEDEVVHGATGSEEGVEGIVISGYEDRYIRLFDANSGEYFAAIEYL